MKSAAVLIVLVCSVLAVAQQPAAKKPTTSPQKPAASDAAQPAS